MTVQAAISEVDRLLGMRDADPDQRPTWAARHAAAHRATVIYDDGTGGE